MQGGKSINAKDLYSLVETCYALWRAGVSALLVQQGITELKKNQVYTKYYKNLKSNMSINININMCVTMDAQCKKSGYSNSDLLAQACAIALTDFPNTFVTNFAQCYRISG